jgi:hypothetical protein
MPHSSCLWPSRSVRSGSAQRRRRFEAQVGRSFLGASIARQSRGPKGSSEDRAGSRQPFKPVILDKLEEQARQAGVPVPGRKAGSVGCLADFRVVRNNAVVGRDAEWTSGRSVGSSAPKQEVSSLV